MTLTLEEIRKTAAIGLNVEWFAFTALNEMKQYTHKLEEFAPEWTCSKNREEFWDNYEEASARALWEILPDKKETKGASE